uniref:Uncharacterized protein n=1 Tax=Leersia perrieri TaxID=77586 RepID=A0A0D9VZ27_9ORYZ
MRGYHEKNVTGRFFFVFLRGTRRLLVQSGDDEQGRKQKRVSKNSEQEEGESKKKMAAAAMAIKDPMLWHKVAAVSGVAALGLGTYGAHMFRPKNPAYKEVWHTASLYHLVHTAALLGAPITKHPTVGFFSACRLFSLEDFLRLGLFSSLERLLFSCRCYTVAYLEDRKYSSTAPLGGFAFIAAWASLLF